jgi:hypothetical protein
MQFANNYEIAYLIAALLNLDEMRIIMHVENGALDQAVESILPDLPEYYANAFQFTDTAHGRRCVQPPDIAGAIAEADCGMFVSNILHVRINPPFAHTMLYGMGFEREKRQRLSEKLITTLHAAVERLEEEANPGWKQAM